ncbi:MAG: PAS domain S-box protein [Gemmataceae bacterium]
MEVSADSPAGDQLGEERFRALVEMSSDAIFLADGQGRLHYASSSIVRVLGYAPDELLGRSGLELVHPEDLPQAEGVLRRTVQGPGEPVSFLMRVRHQDGSWRWVEGVCTNHLDNPAVGAIVVNYRDVSQRRQAEESLRLRAKQLEDAQALAHLGSWEWDVAANVVSWSDPLYGIFGLRPEEFAATFEGYLARVHPEDRDRTRQAIEQALRQRRPFRHEERIVRPDGAVRVLHSQGEVFTDDQGRPLRMAGVCQDVTERKQAEEALRQSEAKYRAIFENAVEGFFQSTPEGRFLTANPALARIYGFASPEEVIAHFDDIAHQLYAEPGRREEFLRRIEADGVVQGFEFQVTRRGGEPAWVSESARVVRDAAGRALYYEGTVEDITPRKQMEQALRKSEASLASAQARAGLGSWEVDPATGLGHWSREMYGHYHRDPTLGPPTMAEFLDLVHPDDRPLILAAQGSAQNSRGPVSVEYRTDPARGPVRHLVGAVEAVRDGAGRVVLLAGTTLDITERKRAEEQRRRLEAQLLHAQKLESLGVLAGGIAHDFNNLLTGILGYASLALMQLHPGSAACPLLLEVEKAAQRAAELTQQMLAYSGRGKFIVQPLRLDQVVQEMVNLLGTVVSKKASLNLELEPATVEGDATQIRQVVMNLITNASDALEGQCGVIAVRTGVRRAGEADLRSAYLAHDLPAGEYACVEVADTGCGMAPETLPRIFDPFFSTKFTGRGLGLAAVLGIVKGHRGAIKVDSARGQGTVFQVLLPAFAGAPAEGRAAPTEEPSPRGHGTVLVVDDEPTIRDLARRALEPAGFWVLEAGDGAEGLELFRQHRQEVVAVLLDLTMPRMDGLEALRGLRLLQADVPVLVMSGYSETEVSTRFAGLGANGFLQKPFPPHDLLTWLLELLPPRGADGHP